MISKKLRWTLWLCFFGLFLLSIFGVLYGEVIQGVVPMALYDSALGYQNLTVADQRSIAQTVRELLFSISLMLMGLSVLWMALAGYCLWRLGKTPASPMPKLPAP